jgi:hypothetical protein
MRSHILARVNPLDNDLQTWALTRMRELACYSRIRV